MNNEDIATFIDWVKENRFNTQVSEHDYLVMIELTCKRFRKPYDVNKKPKWFTDEMIINLIHYILKIN